MILNRSEVFPGKFPVVEKVLEIIVAVRLWTLFLKSRLMSFVFDCSDVGVFTVMIRILRFCVLIQSINELLLVCHGYFFFFGSIVDHLCFRLIYSDSTLTCTVKTLS